MRFDPRAIFTPGILERLNSTLTYGALSRKPLIQVLPVTSTGAGASVAITHNLGITPNAVTIINMTDNDQVWVNSATATTITANSVHGNKSVIVTVMYLSNNFK